MACRDRERRAAGRGGGTCTGCGRHYIILRRGQCHTCFFDSPDALAPLLDRLDGRAPWKPKLLRQLHARAREHGYSAAKSYQHVMRVLPALAASEAASARSFSAAFVSRVRDRVLGGTRPSAAEAALVRCLTDMHLVPKEDWSAHADVGLIEKSIADAPDALRDGMDLYRRSLNDERRYRRSTGERVRSLRTEALTFRYRLLPYAQKLAADSCTSWQQLTPERFRTYAASRSDSPATVSDDLIVLRRFLDVLVRERRIFSNGLKQVQASAGRILGKEPPRDYADALGKVVRGEVPARLRALGALALLHGLRADDIAELRVVDFHARRRELRIRRRRVTIPLDPITFDAITAYLRGRPVSARNPFLFVTSKTAQTARRANVAVLLGAGLGVHVRDRRQQLLHGVLERENAVVAARLFGMSIKQINKHQRLHAIRKTQSWPTVASGLQDSL